MSSETMTVRRAVPALRLWPGDEVRPTPDGGFEVVRRLPPVAHAILAGATARGDVRTAGQPERREG